jgi:hypothetical protein
MFTRQARYAISQFAVATSLPLQCVFQVIPCRRYVIKTINQIRRIAGLRTD